MISDQDYCTRNRRPSIIIRPLRKHSKFSSVSSVSPLAIRLSPMPHHITSSSLAFLSPFPVLFQILSMFDHPSRSSCFAAACLHCLEALKQGPTPPAHCHS